ncbi:MAG TPA: DNA cytosine methyltransferase, partial [Methanosarcina sp.]|nr:DNA cytosine methyltransferase [Methanosarcina sp.]
NREPKIVAMRGRYDESGKTQQQLQEREDGLTNTITCVQKDNLAVEVDYRIRKLTPLECWRLQDFPDEAHEKAKAAGVSDSQRYKQAGNSITVAVMEMIFRQVDTVLKGEHCLGQTTLF